MPLRSLENVIVLGPSKAIQVPIPANKLEGKDTRDRRMMNDIVKRMGKALRQMQEAKVVTRTPQKIKGEYLWQT